MRTFAGQAAGTAEKIRGGYHTPAPIARFLAGGVAHAGPRILEPSCGDGHILCELAAVSGRAHGVELVGTAICCRGPTRLKRRSTWWTDEC